MTKNSINHRLKTRHYLQYNYLVNALTKSVQSVQNGKSVQSTNCTNFEKLYPCYELVLRGAKSVQIRKLVQNTNCTDFCDLNSSC